eukprot:COSAG05_NODE_1358_length_5103_cov_18.985811_3_plen_128_part_00
MLIEDFGMGTVVWLFSVIVPLYDACKDATVRAMRAPATPAGPSRIRHRAHAHSGPCRRASFLPCLVIRGKLRCGLVPSPAWPCARLFQDPSVHPWAIMKPFFVKCGHLLQLTNATQNIVAALAEFQG